MAAIVMRSMLSVPGIRERFIEKARDAEADVLCFDLEDSVAWDDKPAARELLCRVLPDFPKRGRQVFVRTNGYDTGLIEQELDAIVQPWLDGVSVSKIETARDVQRIDDYLTLLERARGLEDGQVKMAAWIENAHAVANAYEICAASERLVGICVGGEDYAVSIGVRRTKGGAELELARRASVNAAHAAGIAPVGHTLDRHPRSRGIRRRAGADEGDRIPRQVLHSPGPTGTGKSRIQPTGGRCRLGAARR